MTHSTKLRLLLCSLGFLFLTHEIEAKRKPKIVLKSFTRFVKTLKIAVTQNDTPFLKQVYSDWEKKGIALTTTTIESLRSGLNKNILQPKSKTICKKNKCEIIINKARTTTRAAFVLRNKKWFYQPPSF